MRVGRRIVAGAVISGIMLTGSATLANAQQADSRAAGVTTLSVEGEQGISAIIRAIKKFGAPVWNKCVTAVKGGWHAFKKWYDGLPAPVRWAIRAASPAMDLYEIFQALSQAIG
ncbi:hypothetical protein M8C13_15890 [Crossiella sp. SN42]|uniref:hypothetical protein n=1 Tax=Crossiella sp. SN42 TaxID=2944808 RepID=UPI00207CD8D0|nr:hypothetical protein [Crossiella sp. SN42]MCO1577237.1 hypothetical protein [Crossiella sp. SN42]